MPGTRQHRIRSKDHRGGVELLLAENVPALGEQGEIVRVKRGYANGRETVEFVERVAQFHAILETAVPETEVAQSLPAKG